MSSANYIVILVGVCGTGKSALGQKVAQRLEVPFFDADKLPPSKDLPEGKFTQDMNLKNWLKGLEELIVDQSSLMGCVISCSILKKEDRKKLAGNIDHEIDWVFMNDKYENVVRRVEKTADYNRPVSQLKSDFEAFERPKRALTIDMGNSEQEVVDTILKYLARKYG